MAGFFIMIIIFINLLLLLVHGSTQAQCNTIQTYTASGSFTTSSTLSNSTSMSSYSPWHFTLFSVSNADYGPSSCQLDGTGIVTSVELVYSTWVAIKINYPIDQVYQESRTITCTWNADYINSQGHSQSCSNTIQSSPFTIQVFCSFTRINPIDKIVWGLYEADQPKYISMDASEFQTGTYEDCIGLLTSCQLGTYSSDLTNGYDTWHSVNNSLELKINPNYQTQPIGWIDQGLTCTFGGNFATTQSLEIFKVRLVDPECLDLNAYRLSDFIIPNYVERQCYDQTHTVQIKPQLGPAFSDGSYAENCFFSVNSTALASNGVADPNVEQSVPDKPYDDGFTITIKADDPFGPQDYVVTYTLLDIDQNVGYTKTFSVEVEASCVGSCGWTADNSLVALTADALQGDTTIDATVMDPSLAPQSFDINMASYFTHGSSICQVYDCWIFSGDFTFMTNYAWTEDSNQVGLYKLTVASSMVTSVSFDVTCYLAGLDPDQNFEVSNASENPDLAASVTLSKPFTYTVSENCAWDNMYVIPFMPLATYQFNKPRGFAYTFTPTDNFGSVASYIGVVTGYSCMPSQCQLVNSLVPGPVSDSSYSSNSHSITWSPPIDAEDDMQVSIKCAKSNGDFIYSDPITMSFPTCSDMSTITAGTNTVEMFTKSDPTTIEPYTDASTGQVNEAYIEPSQSVVIDFTDGWQTTDIYDLCKGNVVWSVIFAANGTEVISDNFELDTSNDWMLIVKNEKTFVESIQLKGVWSSGASNDYILSNSISIVITCDLLSTTLTKVDTSFDIDMIKAISSLDLRTFNTIGFASSNPECPFTELRIETNTFEEQVEFIVDAWDQTSITVTMDESYLELPKQYTYIYVANVTGFDAELGEFTVNINFDCATEEILRAASVPTKGFVTSGKFAILEVQAPIDGSQSHSYPIADAFYSTAAEICPILSYEISKVEYVNGTEVPERLYEAYYSLDINGQFVVSPTAPAVKNQQIYVKAFNDDTEGGDEEPLIDLTLVWQNNGPDCDIPEIVDVNIDVTFKGEYIHTLVETTTPITSAEMEGLPDFMVLVVTEYAVQLAIDTTEAVMGDYSVELTISDKPEGTARRLEGISIFETILVVRFVQPPSQFGFYMDPELEEQVLALRQGSTVPSPALEISWFRFNEVGEATFIFSEDLRELDQLSPPFNVTQISNPNFFDVQYTYNGDSVGNKTPELLHWNVTFFNQKGMKMKFEFSNPLYVSFGKSKDQLQVIFTEPFLFQSPSNVRVSPNITLQRTVPAQMLSEEDYNTAVSTSSQAGGTMWIVLIVSLVLKLAKGMNMDAIFSTIMFTQLVVHFRLLSNVQMPAPTMICYTQIDMMVNFAPEQYPFIQDWINNQGGRVLEIGNWVQSQSVLLIGLIALAALIVLLVILKFLSIWCDLGEYVQDQIQGKLDGLTWNAVIAFFTPSYLPFVYSSVVTFLAFYECKHPGIYSTANEAEDETDACSVQDLVSKCLLFAGYLGFSVFCLIFPTIFKEHLLSPDVKKSYGALYKNLRHLKSSPITTLYYPVCFQMKRLFIAYVLAIGLVDTFTWIHLFSIMYAQIFMLSYIVANRPFAARWLFKLEVFNEIAALSIIYWLWLYAGLITDPELLYFISKWQVYGSYSIIGVNTIVAFVQTFRDYLRETRLQEIKDAKIEAKQFIKDVEEAVRNQVAKREDAEINHQVQGHNRGDKLLQALHSSEYFRRQEQNPLNSYNARKRAQQKRREIEGQPDGWPLHRYLNLDFDKFKSTIVKQEMNGQLKRGTIFYDRIQALDEMRTRDESKAKLEKRKKSNFPKIDKSQSLQIINEPDYLREEDGVIMIDSAISRTPYIMSDKFGLNKLFTGEEQAYESKQADLKEKKSSQIDKRQSKSEKKQPQMKKFNSKMKTIPEVNESQLMSENSDYSRNYMTKTSDQVLNPGIFKPVEAKMKAYSKPKINSKDAKSMMKIQPMRTNYDDFFY